MGTNTIPVVENGMMYIRGVKVELLATPSQTWDVAIHGVVYHITQEQEASLLRAVLYHDDYPSPSRIAQLTHSGKERNPPSPAMMAQMVIISHTCIDDTNTRKPCSEVFGIRGYGYMSKWRAFCYCLPYAFAILIWGTLFLLFWNILKWLFTIDPGTPFSVSDGVCQYLTILVIYTAAEFCSKPGRKYIKEWTNSRILWVIIIFYILGVLIIAYNRHRPYMDQDNSLAMALVLIGVSIASLLAMCIFALNCFKLVDTAIKDGENIDTIDKYA